MWASVSSAQAETWGHCRPPSALAPAGTAPSVRLPSEPDSDSGSIDIEWMSCFAPADGQNKLPVRITTLDSSGHALSTTVTLSVDQGRWVWPDGNPVIDADPWAPGLQITLENGYTEIALESPNTGASARALVYAKGLGQAEAQIEFRQEQRRALLTGLFEGVVQFGSGSSSRPADPFQADLYTWAQKNGSVSAQERLSFFYKGPAPFGGAQTTLSAGFDSIDDPKAKTFADPRPLDTYPILGDGSAYGNEALGSGRLWTRIEDGHDFLMYGDARKAPPDAVFSSMSSLGEPALKPNGILARWTAPNERVTLQAHAAQSSATLAVQEFPSQGSGPYALANGYGVDGTETVEMITRERSNSNHILSRKTLVRLADYSFEPFSGRIILADPLPAFDAALNPLSLRISYSIDQGGPSFPSYGAQFRLAPLSGVQLGAGAHQDDNALAPQALQNLFASWNSDSGRAKILGEWAHSETLASNLPSAPSLLDPSAIARGRATRASASYLSDDEALDAKIQTSKTAPFFSNPGSSASLGQSSTFAQARWRLDGHWILQTEARSHSDERSSTEGTPIASRKTASALVEWRASPRLSLSAGLSYDHFGAGARSLATPAYSDASGSQPSLATGPYGGLGLASQGSPYPAAGANLTGSAFAPEMTSQLALARVRWNATDDLTLSALRQESYSGSFERETSFGADYALNTSTNLYARADWRQGLGSGYGATGTDFGRVYSLGARAQFTANSSVYSEYRLTDTVSGTDAAQVAGSKAFWSPLPGIRLGAGLEKIRAIGSLSPSTGAVFSTAEWTGSPDWRALQKLEWRSSGNYTGLSSSASDKSFHTVLSETYLASRLTKNWSAMGRIYALKTHTSNGDGLASRAQAGAAFRDTDTNKTNALFAYEYRAQKDPNSSLNSTGSLNILQEVAHTLSTTADWHPTRPWWITARVAYQHRTGVYEHSTPDSYAGFFQAARLTWDITEQWDASALISSLSDHHARQSSWGLELGRAMAKNLWIGAGYNVQGFNADSSLAGSTQTRQGFFLRLRLKFDEHSFLTPAP